MRSFDGAAIRYALLGPHGAPVVALCAGFLCPDTYWKYLVPALVDDYRVLVWNYRGIGVSELPRWPGFHALNIDHEDLGIEACARDLHAIFEAEGIEHAVLVGHSMGVQVVLESYRQEPQRFAGLVSMAGAYCTPLRTFYGTDITGRLAPYALPLLHLLPRVTLLAWRSALHGPLSYPVGRYVARAVGPNASAEDMAGYFEHLSMTDPLIAAKMVEAMHAHSAADVLPKIDVPVLLLHGNKDPFTPLVVAKDMEAAIPDARLVVFEGGSHTLPIEHPEEVDTEVSTFLRRLDLGPGRDRSDDG